MYGIKVHNMQYNTKHPLAHPMLCALNVSGLDMAIVEVIDTHRWLRNCSNIKLATDTEVMIHLVKKLYLSHDTN